MAQQTYYPFIDEQKGAQEEPTGMGAQAGVNTLPGMIYHRPAFAHVEMTLSQGQQVLADGGAMIWKDSHLQMKTKKGDCGPACMRKCAGETCCQNLFTGPGLIAFSFKLPGDMLPFHCTTDMGWKLSSGSFVCGTSNIQVDSTFSGCYACCCGGEEAWLSLCTIKSDPEGKNANNGIFYAGGYGALTKHELEEGQQLVLSSGLFFASAQDFDFELVMPGGCFTCWCGGEGLCVSFTGPGMVYSQNRDPSSWKHVLAKEGAKNKNSGNTT